MNDDYSIIVKWESLRNNVRNVTDLTVLTQDFGLHVTLVIFCPKDCVSLINLCVTQILLILVPFSPAGYQKASRCWRTKCLRACNQCTENWKCIMKHCRTVNNTKAEVSVNLSFKFQCDISVLLAHLLCLAQTMPVMTTNDSAKRITVKSTKTRIFYYLRHVR